MDDSALLMFALLLFVSAGGAALLRWARCPGWPVVGGVVAGIVLGPTIFGRVLPDQYEAMFVGGVDQHLALRQLTGRQGADLIVAERAGYDAGQMVQLEQRHAREYAEAEGLWQEAKWTHQRPLRLFTSTIVALMLLGAGAVSVRRSAEGEGIVAPLSVGAWSAALPGGLAFFAMRWWWGQGVAESALVAAAVAIGPWVLTRIDREAADQAELGGARMVQTAGRIATLLALVAAGWALWAVHGLHGLAMGAPLLAAPISWLLTPKKGSGSDPFWGWGWVAGALHYLLVPTLAACVAIKIELYQHFALWPIVVLLLLSGDGRWLGAFTGAMVLGGRRGLRTMRLVLGSMAAGPTQLAVAAIAMHSGSIPPKFAMALLFGAVLIEVMAPVRRAMARRLIQTEQEIEAMSDER